MVEENYNTESVENTDSQSVDTQDSNSDLGSAAGFEIESVEDPSEKVKDAETLTIETEPSKAQESSLNNDNTSSEQSEPDESEYGEVELDDQDMIEVLNQKYDTNFDSMEEFEDAVSSQDETSYSHNEKLDRIDRFMQETGGTLEDYLYMESLDFDEMSDEDIIKEAISRENPSLDEKEINFLFDKNYPSFGTKKGDDNYNEDELREDQILLKSDAASLRDEFQDEKDEYLNEMFEGEEYEEGGDEQAEYEYQARAAEARDEWLSELDFETQDLTGIEFQINDKGDVFTYDIPEEDKESLYRHNSDLGNFFDRYVDNQGNWNYDRLNSEMYVLNNMDKIMKSLANQYSSQGREGIIKDIKNPSYEQTKRSSNSGKSESLEGQILDSMYGAGGTLRIK